MPAVTINAVLQLIVGLGLLNVWLLRGARRTSYRGGGAQTLREEFAAYQLPTAAFYLVGALKVVAGVILLAGLWWPLPVRAAAGAGVPCIFAGWGYGPMSMADGAAAVAAGFADVPALADRLIAAR